MVCPWCGSLFTLCSFWTLDIHYCVSVCVTVIALSSLMLLVFKLELQHAFKCLSYGFHAIFIKSPVNKNDGDLTQCCLSFRLASVWRGKEREMRIATKSAGISKMSLNWQKLNVWETAHNGNNEISQVNACRALATRVCSVIALSCHWFSLCEPKYFSCVWDLAASPALPHTSLLGG